MSFTRRHFLLTAGAVSLGFAGLRNVFAGGAAEEILRSVVESSDGWTSPGYGPLLSDPKGVLDLPEGFAYTIFSRQGEEMDDGLLVPRAHDGMAAFPGPKGRTILVRNHELSPGTGGPFGENQERLAKIDKGRLYDRGFGRSPGQGGTTTLIYNTETQALERHFMSLAGTERNCAGGPTPWNSWVTSEETVSRVDNEHEKEHGFNFEVPASAKELVRPVALKAMGRFNHEAIAVDPKSGCVYQTEDRHEGLIYRYLPDKPGNLAAGGKLQALAIRGREKADTRNWKSAEFRQGETVETDWIDMEDILAPNDDLRIRGHDAGAAVFARGEGMWYGADAVYFACTNGGSNQKGQVWRYFPSPAEGTDRERAEPGRLELFLEPNAGHLVENCDNVTVAPWGDLVLCEDGGSPNYLVGVRPDGGIYKIARPSKSGSELAGATFSPDGSTLFFNIQGDGLTLALTGPWEKIRGA